MGSSNNIVNILTGAPRRAFCSTRQLRQFAFLASVFFHAALLFALQAKFQSHVQHGRAASSQIERMAPVQNLQVTLVAARVEGAIKKTATTVNTKPSVNKRAAMAAASRQMEPVAESPTLPASPQAVQGLALPQPMMMQGKRSLWSSQSYAPAPDAQAMYQAEIQRQSLIAKQSLLESARKAYEAQLMAALGDVQLQASCSLTLSSNGEITSRCEDEQDQKNVIAVLGRSGNAPAMQGDRTALIIDLRPQQNGGLLSVARRAQLAESLNF